MIHIEIKDVNGQAVSLGDKINIINESTGRTGDDVYVVNFIKTDDQLFIGAIKENSPNDAGYIPLGGFNQPRFQIVEYAQSSNFTKHLEGKKMYLIANRYDCQLRSIELVQELKNLNFKGVCVVDMMLVVGKDAFNRFWEVEFDGENFGTLFPINGSSKLLKIEKTLFKQHPELIENSILTQEEKIEILRK